MDGVYMPPYLVLRKIETVFLWLDSASVLLAAAGVYEAMAMQFEP
jgi:hypothetical protein